MGIGLQRGGGPAARRVGPARAAAQGVMLAAVALLEALNGLVVGGVGSVFLRLQQEPITPMLLVDVGKTLTAARGEASRGNPMSSAVRLDVFCAFSFLFW